jgi:SAM-dependent methyltransferase
VRQDTRAPFDDALAGAREAAFAPGEYVGQESFMRAREILALAERAGIGPGVSVLDLCCGVAGPGRFITRQLGPRYLGVDASAGAVELASARAVGLPCRFEVAEVPPLPPDRYDVVVLLETMLAFRDKDALVGAIAAALAPGGRFAFTLEEGRPLTELERARMPDADTVWPTPLAEMREALAHAGLAVTWQEDCSPSHRAVAESLLEAYAADASAIAARIGRPALDDLLTAHRLWADWLSTGRIRKFALVTQSGSDPERRP